MTDLERLGESARKASVILSTADAGVKDKALLAIASAIDKRRDEWIAANLTDLAAAREGLEKEAAVF